MPYTPARTSLSKRLSLSLGLLSTAVVLFVLVSVFLFLSERVGARMETQASSTLAFLGQALEAPFWTLDREGAVAVAQATTMDPGVGRLVLLDARGDQWFSYSTGRPLFISHRIEVRHENQVIGHVEYGLEDSVRVRAVAEIGLASGGIALVLILTQYLLAGRLLRYYFQKPFKALDLLVGAYARGDYSPADPGLQYTEFEPLVHAFLDMGQTIKRHMNDLRESEEKFRAIFNNSPVGIFRTTVDGVLVEGNPALARMFRYRGQEDYLERKGFHIDSSYADPGMRKTLLDLLRISPEAARLETVFIRSDGSKFEGVLTAAVQLGADGSPAFLNGVVEDVSARKQAERLLRQSEEKFSRLFRLSPDAILLIQFDDGRILDANEAFTRLTGFSWEEALGRTPLELGLYVNPSERDVLREMLQVRGQVENMDVLARRKDGMAVPCVLSSQILQVDGRDCIMAVLRDVTEFRRMQEIMIQSEKMISVGGIAAGVAHEINNPLGIITVTSQNLIQRTKPDFPKNIAVASSIGLDMNLLDQYMQARGLHEFIRNIQEAALRAAEIIRHMLDFSRRSESRRKVCDMRPLIERAIHLAESDYDLKKNYDFRKIEILWECDSPQALVNCTETEMEQVFLNLLRNAAQAMASAPQEIPDPRIVIRIAVREGRVIVEVDDNGPGMPADVQRRAFEPFFTTKPPGVGTGLGLSVSYFIVTRGHDGQMSLESQPGHGTKFVISLPAYGKDER